MELHQPMTPEQWEQIVRNHRGTGIVRPGTADERLAPEVVAQCDICGEPTVCLHLGLRIRCTTCGVPRAVRSLEEAFAPWAAAPDC